MCIRDRYSGEKTGRSPKDRRIVKNEESEGNIDWGNVNLPIDEHTFMINKVRAVDYLNSKDIIYVIDGFEMCIRDSPFSAQTMIAFTIPSANDVVVKIHDVSGKELYKTCLLYTSRCV